MVGCVCQARGGATVTPDVVTARQPRGERQVVGDVGNNLVIWAGHGDDICGRFNAEQLNSGCCTLKVVARQNVRTVVLEVHVVLHQRENMILEEPGGPSYVMFPYAWWKAKG